MKLVEILARELREWPVGAVSVCQDNDGAVWSYGGFPKNNGDQWLIFDVNGDRIELLCSVDVDEQIADDLNIAAVTREMWQAERERLGEEVIPGKPTIKPTQTIDQLAWRDRIHEIDATTKALAEERASLVDKLKAEGFALLGDAEKADSAPEEDMSDPSNWRVGDLFEVIGKGNHHFEVGEIVRLVVLESGAYIGGNQYEHLDSRDFWWVKDVNVKFHSRPTT